MRCLSTSVLLSAVLGLIVAAGCSAEPVAVFAPGGTGGVSIVSQPDGPCKQVTLGGRECVIPDELDGYHYGNGYLYVRVAPELRSKVGPDAYMLIEYYDTMLGQFDIDYNSATKDYDRGPSVRLVGGNVWDRVIVRLKDARFRGTENGGSDLRFPLSGKLAISRIEIYSGKPDVKVTTDRERAARLAKTLAALPKNGKPGNGMGYVFGDNAQEVTYPERRYETPFGCNRDDTTIKIYKSLGVTSVETYVTWETCEKDGEGKWDWRLWDKQLQVCKANDMKWTPFLILGPAYSTPNWFRASKDHFPCRCLEHGTDSKIESLWNPNMPKLIDRFLGAFAERYGKTGVLQYVLLGIQGDYGESIYSVFGGWTEFIPGAYHAHRGLWCDDPYALADFRKSEAAKYGTVGKLNHAWGTDFLSLDNADFPGRGDALTAFKKEVEAGKPQARRRWLDFIDWYRASMTRFVDYWTATAKKHFPKTPVYVCTGGLGEPEHGSQFAEQCRVAAKNGCGVRITNEGPGYQWNHVLTRWVASAGRLYGAPTAFEPASNIDLNTLPGRIFNATVSGCAHLHDYSRNIISSNERMAAQRKAFKELKHVAKPIIPVALWYPNVSLTLNHAARLDGFVQGSAKLMDYTDHDYVDETMLRSKALSRYKVLLILSGEVMESADAKLIADWAKSGGDVIVMGVNRFESVEATSAPESTLFADNPSGGALGRGRIIRVADWPALASALRDSLTRTGLPVADLKEDYVYTSILSPTEILCLNTAPTPVSIDVTVAGKTSTHRIEPSGIQRVTLGK